MWNARAVIAAVERIVKGLTTCFKAANDEHTLRKQRWQILQSLFHSVMDQIAENTASR